MQSRQSNTRQSLHDVQAFLDLNAGRLGAIAATGMRQKLDAEIVELDTFAAGQAGHGMVAKGTTQKYRVLREALLRDHMAPIASLARAELPRAPEIAPLLMPRGRISVDKLALHATAMAHAAAPFREMFVRACLPADFIEQLVAATDAMLEAFRQRSLTRGMHAGATRGLGAKLSECRKIVRVLDRLVTSALRDDPALLANWQSLRRVRGARRNDAAAAPASPGLTAA